MPSLLLSLFLGREVSSVHPSKGGQNGCLFVPLLPEKLNYGPGQVDDSKTGTRGAEEGGYERTNDKMVVWDFCLRARRRADVESGAAPTRCRSLVHST